MNRNNLVHQLFEEQACSHPDKIALTFEDEGITYRHLNSLSNSLAYNLLIMGIGSGHVVAIGMERSIEMIVTLLAILKTGATYLPLDPTLPESRIAFMLENSKALLAITDSIWRAKFDSLDTPVSCYNEYQEFHLSRNLTVPMSSDQPAYLIYTSGSTGKPKGVSIQHSSLVSFLRAMTSELDIKTDENFLALTTIAFDIAGLEIFLPIVTGNSFILVPKTTSTNGEELIELIQRTKPTLVQATPSTWEILLSSGWQGNQEVKILSGGEKLPEKLAKQLCSLGQMIRNVYGPTETTIWSTCGKILSDNPVTIGLPLKNSRTFVLNDFGEIVPLGVWGELYIGGEGVALGYLHRPDLTAQSFVPNDFNKEHGRRLYKTGDLARYLPDGQIECGGRKDHQIKFWGHRIELGEVESAILEYDKVQQAVVSIQELQNNKIMNAYLVANMVEKEIDFVNKLRFYLEERLPSYMIPHQFIRIDALPLTPNGKIDRAALSNLVLTKTEHNNQKEILNSTETGLHQIWLEFLHLDNLSIDDNFFKIGGHSLLATQVIFSIREIFNIDLPLRDLFAFPTIRKLAQRLDEKDKSALPTESVHAEISRNGITKLPLSYSQQRLWFIDEMFQGTGLYNIPTAYIFTGDLEISLFERAVEQIVHRHESLRAYISIIEGQSTQNIATEIPVPLYFEDFTHDTPSAIKFLQDEVQRPFDLSHAPLARFSLLKLERQKHLFIVVMHHIISDARSIEIFFSELEALYNSLSVGNHIDLIPLKFRYSDFVINENSPLQTTFIRKQFDYWISELKDIPELLQLPFDYPRPLQLTHKGSILHHRLSKSLVQDLRNLCEKYEVSLFMLLLSAFKVLLFRYSGKKDIIVGTPVSSRINSELNKLIGFFVNTLAIRTSWQGDIDFETLLAQVRDKVIEGYENQNVPFDQLVATLKLQRDLSKHPIFQVLFMLENEVGSKLNLNGVQAESINIETQTSKFDLSLWAKVDQEEMILGFEYSTELFEEETICSMALHLTMLLQEITRNPQSSISNFPILTEAETDLFLDLQVDTKGVYPSVSLTQLLENHAQKTPERIALVFEDQYLSYAELNSKSNALSRYLRELGVGPEVLVGIGMHRSPESIIAMFAILKSGGGYVPLDPTFPNERICYILESSKIQFLITHSFYSSIFEAFNGKSISLDNDWEAIQCRCSRNLNLPIHDLNRAFVFYTSGSTGHPKGVEGHHRGIVNRLNWMISSYPFEEGEMFSQRTSLGIVDSFFEIFDSLAAGATFAISSNEHARDLHKYVEDLKKYSVTRIIFVPSFLEAIIDEFGDQLKKLLNSLKLVLIGGEPLTSDLTMKFHKIFPKVPLINLFGATETTAEVTYLSVENCSFDKKLMPIGKSISNCQSYILNDSFQLVPRGVIGDLYIGGVGLTRGYLDQPDLTALKFIPNPYGRGSGKCLYHIGDLGKMNREGNLEYLGRGDLQINLRGFRVEPIEIEMYLNSHPAVNNSIVVLDKASTGQSLLAYIQCRDDYKENVGKSFVQELKEHLSEKIPMYMIPERFVFVEKFNYTSGGKISRKELPKIALDLEQDNYVHPRNEIEFKMSKIWEGLLGIRGIGIFTSFFEIGGNSLLAMRFISQFKKQFNANITVAEVFKYPTIAQLSKYVDCRSKFTDFTIQIQSSVNEQSLYLVHPAMGVAFPYNLLSAHIDHVSIYGINSPFYGEVNKRFKSIEEMASKYIQFLPEDRSLILGGWSFGGMVAYEMARQLVILKRPPKLLILIDSFNATKFGKSDFEDPPDSMNEFLLSQGIKPFSDEYEDAKSEIENNLQLAMKYFPQSYSGEVSLLKAMVSEKYNQRAFEDPTNGWKDIVKAKIKVHPISCQHGEMFSQKCTPVVAKELLEVLKQMTVK